MHQQHEAYLDRLEKGLNEMRVKIASLAAGIERMKEEEEREVLNDLRTRFRTAEEQLQTMREAGPDLCGGLEEDMQDIWADVTVRLESARSRAQAGSPERPPSSSMG